jgi:hypothetical protein
MRGLRVRISQFDHVNADRQHGTRPIEFESLKQRNTVCKNYHLLFGGSWPYDYFLYVQIMRFYVILKLQVISDWGIWHYKVM